MSIPFPPHAAPRVVPVGLLSPRCSVSKLLLFRKVLSALLSFFSALCTAHPRTCCSCPPSSLNGPHTCRRTSAALNTANISPSKSDMSTPPNSSARSIASTSTSLLSSSPSSARTTIARTHLPPRAFWIAFVYAAFLANSSGPFSAISTCLVCFSVCSAFSAPSAAFSVVSAIAAPT